MNPHESLIDCEEQSNCDIELIRLLYTDKKGGFGLKLIEFDKRLLGVFIGFLVSLIEANKTNRGVAFALENKLFTDDSIKAPKLYLRVVFVGQYSDTYTQKVLTNGRLYK